MTTITRESLAGTSTPALVEPEQAIARWKANPELMATVRQAVFPQAQTEAELALFLHDCHRQGCHPLDRMIHPTVYADQKTGQRRYVAVTSIDLMRSRAADTGEYAGSDEPEYGPEIADKDGNNREYKRPDWCRVTVYRIVQGQRYGFTHKAWWSEYYPGDSRGSMWRKMPHNQLAKCTEAAALRKGFPRELGRLYVEGEAPEDEATPARDLIRRADSTGTTDAAARIATNPPPSPSAAEVVDDSPEPEGPQDGEDDPLAAYDRLMKASLRVKAATGGTVTREWPEGSGKVYVIYKPVLEPSGKSVKISENGEVLQDACTLSKLAQRLEAEAEAKERR